jgi:hypothetical protein
MRSLIEKSRSKRINPICTIAKMVLHNLYFACFVVPLGEYGRPPMPNRHHKMPLTANI